MAVPTGTYEAHLSIDLTPLFGKLEDVVPVEIVKPGADALDRRIEQLSSEDPEVRREAVLDLRFFLSGKNKEKVANAAATVLRDPDSEVRMQALVCVMMCPPVAKRHWEDFLFILENDDGGHWGKRMNAAMLLSAYAPWDDRVLAALETAAASDDRNLAGIAKSALTQYRTRHSKNR